MKLFALVRSPRVLCGLGLLWLHGTAPAQTAPIFTSIQRLPNGEVRMQLSAAAGQNIRIDRSDDLLAWEPLVTMPGAALLNYTNVGAVYHRQGFYRAAVLTGTDILTGDHLVTDNGDVVIRPLYHASFVMKWNGKMIYSDPDSTANYTGLAKADLILVTHSHGDHFDAATIDTLRQPTTIIVAPQEVYTAMNATQRGLTTVLANGATTSPLGLSVQAVPAYNLAPGTIYHTQGVGNGYVVTIGGRRIYIAGDTEDIPATRTLQNIDVAFVCINIPFTMTVDQGISTVREFRPKVVYPYHYRNSDQTFSDLNRFKTQVGTDLGIEVRLGKWY